MMLIIIVYYKDLRRIVALSRSLNQITLLGTKLVHVNSAK